MITINDFTRINNDVNGNPRYVFHFSNLINELERKKSYEESDIFNGISCISIQYNIALKKAKKIHGRKFNNKQYGGGIVIQSYNLYDDIKLINELMNNNI